MKLMRRISGLLSAVLLTSCLLYTALPKMLPDTTLNVYAENTDVLTFTIYSDSATLKKCDTYATGEIEIPEKINDVPVTVIAPRAFQDCSSITSIKMPDSIKTIGEEAFFNATQLESINISKSVHIIPEFCFRMCQKLGDVVLPENIESVISGGFSSASMNSITIMNPSLNLSFLENFNGSVKTVSGYPDSTAESYAKRHGKPFVALEGAPPTTTGITTTTTNNKIINGLRKYDINKDSHISIADAVLLTRIVSEDETVVLPQDIEPDVNADGLVTIEDVMDILHALQPFSIQIGKTTAKPGEKVSVPIKIYADKGTAAGQIYVAYDSKLTPVSVKSGDAYTMNFHADCEAYPITITWTAKDGNDQIAKNGAVLAQLEFEVDSNIKSSEYLEISIMNQVGSYTTSFSDSSGITYTAGYRSGYITVIP